MSENTSPLREDHNDRDGNTDTHSKDEVKTDYPLICISIEGRDYAQIKNELKQYITYDPEPVVASGRHGFGFRTLFLTTFTQEKLIEFIDYLVDSVYSGIFVSIREELSDNIIECDKIDPKLIEKILKHIPLIYILRSTVISNNKYYFSIVLDKIIEKVEIIIEEHETIFYNLCLAENDERIDMMITFNEKVYHSKKIINLNIIDNYEYLIVNNSYKTFCYVLEHMSRLDPHSTIPIKCDQFVEDILCHQKHEFIDELIKHHEIDTNPIEFFSPEELVSKLKEYQDSLDYLMELDQSGKLILHPEFLKCLNEARNESK